MKSPVNVVITGAAGQIEHAVAAFDAGGAGEIALPQSVNAQGHQIVHHIVFRGDRSENALHAAGFFLFPNGLKAEMRCSVCCFRHGLLP